MPTLKVGVLWQPQILLITLYIYIYLGLKSLRSLGGRLCGFRWLFLDTLSCNGLFVGMLLPPKNVCVNGNLPKILYVGSVLGARNRLIICSSNVVSVDEFGII
jgi:hypothetical protein